MSSFPLYGKYGGVSFITIPPHLSRLYVAEKSSNFVTNKGKQYNCLYHISFDFAFLLRYGFPWLDFRV